MLSRKLLIVSVAAGFAATPMLASADSQISFGNGAVATADLDFQVVIPEFVYLQVGSPGGTVDQVGFDLLLGGVPAGSGSMNANSGNAEGIDGIIPVTLISNAANVEIMATGADLTSGGDTIPLTDIAAADGGVIAHPAFNGAPTSLTSGAYNDNWTFTYSNTATPPAGTYDSTVTYTATAL